MSSLSPQNWLLLKRVVRFGETDAAGVMHFHQIFRWCHEAWEESLEKYGLRASQVFPNDNEVGGTLEVFLPIVHCHADFRLPIKNGDQLSLKLMPTKIDLGSFELKVLFQRGDEDVAIGVLHHLAINSQTRKRCPLPEEINLWLEASSVQFGLRPL